MFVAESPCPENTSARAGKLPGHGLLSASLDAVVVTFLSLKRCLHQKLTVKLKQNQNLKLKLFSANPKTKT